jgi:hypothetical protein
LGQKSYGIADPRPVEYTNLRVQSFSPLLKLQGPAQHLGPELWPRCNVTPRIIASPVLLFSGVILLEESNRMAALTRAVLMLFDQAWIESIRVGLTDFKEPALGAHRGTPHAPLCVRCPLTLCGRTPLLVGRRLHGLARRQASTRYHTLLEEELSSLQE